MFGLVKATHNRAGEITYKHISGFTYEFTVTIYADPDSDAFKSRKTIEINWGDNTGLDSLSVTNVIPINPDVWRRDFVGRHTFASPGTFRIGVNDPNRNAGIDNISNSVNVPFYVDCLLRIFPFGNEINNSPDLLYPPIDNACVGQVYVHNPGAYDVDGDSLVYKLARSKGAGGVIAPGYEFPPFSTSLNINSTTGDFVWDFPVLSGTYNISIRIQEYRNGVLIGEVIRDMQIDVFPGCINNPPVINVQNKVCVEANSRLSIPVTATDVDNLDEVNLQMIGEPFYLPQGSASYTGLTPANPIIDSLIWNVNCSHIRIKPYSVTIKATDNSRDENRGIVNLSSFKKSEILVISPAPKNFTSKAIKDEIKLSWSKSECSNAVGYFVYRRLDSSGFMPNQCQVGVPESTGYIKIAELNSLLDTTFSDNNFGEGLTPGRRFCYLVTAVYSDGAESYASEEVCAEVQKFVPIITNVSIEETDSQNGKILLSWSPPDTINNTDYPPPYKYILYKESVLIDSTNSINDTNYFALGNNTIDLNHTFRVELYSYGNGKTLVGKSPLATSIFLASSAGDNKVRLSWTSQVPWENDSFIVYRKSPTDLTFDSIGVTYNNQYIDNNLSNELAYSYYIESYGEYELNSVKTPLVNKSQQVIETPIDNEPPCKPNFNIKADCELESLLIEWNDSVQSCQEDIVKYQIYQAQRKGQELLLKGEVLAFETKEFRLLGESISGCYQVLALDSAGNKSSRADTICVEYCPSYELPNIFTPNGDGINDLFVPYPNYRDVDSIELKIFNRWGEQVFATSNPQILWDGVSKRTDEKLFEGVYYYYCTVFERTLEGVLPRYLKGTLNIQSPNGFRKKE